MTLTGDDAIHPQPDDAPGTVRATGIVSRPGVPGSVVHRACPYLLAGDGSWRTLVPAREQRCGATQPASPLTIAKQRDLCTQDVHRGCATFVAARELEQGSSGRPEGASDGLWPPTLGAVLAVEPARGAVSGSGSVRAGGQALLIGLMVLAFLVLVIARTAPPSATGGATPLVAGGAPAPTSTPAPSTQGEGSPAVDVSPPGLVEPSAAPPSKASPSPTASSATPSLPPASPAATPTAPPTPAASPSGQVRYVVKSGDSLSSIATKFNTTVRKLKVANQIKDASLIRVGQVLIIP